VTLARAKVSSSDAPSTSRAPSTSCAPSTSGQDKDNEVKKKKKTLDDDEDSTFVAQKLICK
jgi:hypothetical protein